MLEWNGDPCFDTLGIPCGSRSPISIVFIVTGESRNATMICYGSESNITLKDSSGVKVDSGLPLFCCLLMCTRDMPESIY